MSYDNFNMDLPSLDEALHTSIDTSSVVHPHPVQAHAPVKGKPAGPSKKGKPAGPKKKGHAASGHAHSSGSKGGHGSQSQGVSGKAGHGGSSSGKAHKSKKSSTDTLDAIQHIKETAPWMLNEQAAIAYEQTWVYVPQTHAGHKKLTPFTPVYPHDRTKVVKFGKNGPKVVDGKAGGTKTSGGSGKHTGHPGHHQGSSHRGKGGSHKSLSGQVETAGSMAMTSTASHGPSVSLHIPGPVRISSANHH